MKQETFASILKAHSCQAYVIYDTAANPDMRYLTSFSIHDPVLYIHYANNKRELIVPEMEVARARYETDHTVISRNELGYREIFSELRDQYKTIARIIQSRCPGKILIPQTMPAALAFLAHLTTKYTKINLSAQLAGLPSRRKEGFLFRVFRAFRGSF